MYKFEKLNVWQESIKLGEICYKITSTLPNIERNGLGDQLRRAVTSILLNIAEGSGSGTDKEFKRYLYLSRKSLFEVVAILKFIEKIYLKINLMKVFVQCDLVGKLLNGLIKKLKSNS
jgi:four helix bundle protein